MSKPEITFVCKGSDEFKYLEETTDLLFSELEIFTANASPLKEMQAEYCRTGNSPYVRFKPINDRISETKPRANYSFETRSMSSIGIELSMSRGEKTYDCEIYFEPPKKS
ncbi:MAG: hypothetical protein ACP5N2_07515 [Candidatus Nanoarchaeia archaeon]